MVMRRIARTVPTLTDLGVPTSAQDLAKAKQGLVLVCGPTGSGKSTTLCALLEQVNATRVEHVVTIEDPIEYIFENKKCIFSQREIGTDTPSFSLALRAAMRQDPDIVMVGELRDQETITTALNLCETGHLVLATMHTSGASQTLSRIVQAYPLEQRTAILGRVADSLLGVISQRLVTKKEGGLTALFEVLLATPGVRASVRSGDLPQLENTLATSAASGMQTMRHAAHKAIEAGLVERATVEEYLQEQ